MPASSIPTEKALERLRVLASDAQKLTGTVPWAPRYIKWHRDVRVALEGIFGLGSSHSAEFEAISFDPVESPYNTRETLVRECTRGLSEAAALLASFIEELELYATVERSPDPPIAASSLVQLASVVDRFHIVVRQLLVRHAGRATLTVEDEYDVQDLLHALLYLSFSDIRREEWTPSYAGGASRVDMLLKPERILVEAKMARPRLLARDIADQLIIDIDRYQTHPDCGHLFCLVYDPNGLLHNPRGFERDLVQQRRAIPVTVSVIPK